MLLESDEIVFVKAARQRMQEPECRDEALPDSNCFQADPDDNRERWGSTGILRYIVAERVLMGVLLWRKEC